MGEVHNLLETCDMEYDVIDMAINNAVLVMDLETASAAPPYVIWYVTALSWRDYVLGNFRRPIASFRCSLDHPKEAVADWVLKPARASLTGSAHLDYMNKGAAVN